MTFLYLYVIIKKTKVVNDNIKEHEKMEQLLEVKNIRKTFVLTRKQRKTNRTTERLKVAVDGLSFSVRKGEIYGLLGPNGAGKTTTLRMISTLISPDEGEITVKGFNAKKEQNQVRRNIAFLTSELKLEEFFTPNYLFDFFSDLHGVDPETRDTWKNTLFQKFGIHEFKDIKVSSLSTGMKQKASIAISLVHNPDIIIFDEPTNGLDVITAKVVTDFLQDLKVMGKTIIISTHIYSLIEKICDRVGIIIQGKMVADASLEELCKEKSLEDVFFQLYQEHVGDVQ